MDTTCPPLASPARAAAIGSTRLLSQQRSDLHRIGIRARIKYYPDCPLTTKVPSRGADWSGCRPKEFTAEAVWSTWPCGCLYQHCLASDSGYGLGQPRGWRGCPDNVAFVTTSVGHMRDGCSTISELDLDTGEPVHVGLSSWVLPPHRSGAIAIGPARLTASQDLGVIIANSAGGFLSHNRVLMVSAYDASKGRSEHLIYDEHADRGFTAIGGIALSPDGDTLLVGEQYHPGSGGANARAEALW